MFYCSRKIGRNSRSELVWFNLKISDHDAELLGDLGLRYLPLVKRLEYSERYIISAQLPIGPPRFHFLLRIRHDLITRLSSHSFGNLYGLVNSYSKSRLPCEIELQCPLLGRK